MSSCINMLHECVRRSSVGNMKIKQLGEKQGMFKFISEEGVNLYNIKCLKESARNVLVQFGFNITEQNIIQDGERYIIEMKFNELGEAYRPLDNLSDYDDDKTFDLEPDLFDKIEHDEIEDVEKTEVDTNPLVNSVVSRVLGALGSEGVFEFIELGILKDRLLKRWDVPANLVDMVFNKLIVTANQKSNSEEEIDEAMVGAVGITGPLTPLMTKKKHIKEDSRQWEDSYDDSEWGDFDATDFDSTLMDGLEEDAGFDDEHPEDFYDDSEIEHNIEDDEDILTKAKATAKEIYADAISKFGARKLTDAIKRYAISKVALSMQISFEEAAALLGHVIGESLHEKYSLRKRGDKWAVIKDDGKNMGFSKSKEKAEAHMRALYANIPKNEAIDIDTPEEEADEPIDSRVIDYIDDFEDTEDKPIEEIDDKEDFHSKMEDLGIDPHEAEEMVYKALYSLLHGEEPKEETIEEDKDTFEIEEVEEDADEEEEIDVEKLDAITTKEVIAKQKDLLDAIRKYAESLPDSEAKTKGKIWKQFAKISNNIAELEATIKYRG